MSDPTLRSAFARAAPAVSLDSQAERDLAAFVARARQGHAKLDLDDPGFVQFVAARTEPDASLTDQLGAMAAADLYLAYGCRRGDPLALELFVLEYGDDIDRAAAKGRSAGIAVEDFRATMLEKLFVDPARIEQYTGRGALRGWVRVVAVRMVVDLVRKAAVRPVQGQADTSDMLRLVGDEEVELGYLAERYRQPVRSALEAAFDALSPRQRNLLRLRVLQQLNHDQLGARYGVHRTTAARWLADAQARLLAQTKTVLHERFGVATSEFESVVRLVQSRIHLSVRRILRTELEAEA